MKQTGRLPMVILAGICFSFGTLAAGGQQEPESHWEAAASEILMDYDFNNLTEEDIRAIHDAFRDQGLRGGPELDKVIEAAGFDPEKLKSENPPSQAEKSPQPRDAQNQTPGKIYESLSTDYNTPDFTLISQAIEDGVLLEQYRCEKKVNGTEKSIPLAWGNVPEGTESLAIVMYHYPHPEDKSHVNSYLLLWGLAPTVTEITYGEAINGEWYMGRNKDGDAVSYTSPCSPNPGSHEYVIVIFALSEYPEDLPQQSSIDVDFSTFMDALEKVEILGKGELIFKG